MKHKLSLLSLGIILLLPCFAISLADAAPAKTSRLYYTGTIGKMAVQMDLTFDKTQVDGNYWYKANPVLYNAKGDERNMLALKGSLSATGQVMLVEKVTSRKQTGVITGAFTKSSTQFVGVWSKADHTDVQPVRLRAVARYITISQVDHKRHIQSTATYPKLLTPGLPSSDVTAYLHAKCTTAMSKFISDCLEYGYDQDTDRAITQDYTISLAYYSARFVCLLAEDDADIGAVVDNLTYETFNLALKPKDFHALSFDELFEGGSRDKLANLLSVKLQSLKRVRNPKDWGEDKDEPDQDTLSNIMLLPKGAVFVLPEGSYFVTIPYSELSGLMILNEGLPSFVKAAKK